MKIGLIGRSELLYEILSLFLKKKIKIQFVYTSKSEKYYKKKEIDFKKICIANNINFFCDNKINKNVNILKKQKTDLVFSTNCQIKLSKEILKIFKKGVYNAHLGDLPKYRGNATPNWSIINKEKKIALCIHQMSEGIDEGKIAMKEYLYLKNNTYIEDIYKWSALNIPKNFYKTYNLLKRNNLKLKKQIGKPLRTFPRKKIDSRIKWHESSDKIYDLIRASSTPFDGAFCYFESKKIYVLKAKIYKPKYNFYAVPGQVCFANNNNPVIAADKSMIELTSLSLNKKDDIKLKKMILKSLRNRLY